jgi:hypothetical protein
MGDYGMDSRGRHQLNGAGRLPVHYNTHSSVLPHNQTPKPGMEPKLIAMVFGIIGVPLLGVSFFGYIGAVSMADWKVTVFFILWSIAFSLRLYYRHIEKSQKKKLTDIEIERQRRELESEILPHQ